jgi:hypothetical protein
MLTEKTINGSRSITYQNRCKAEAEAESKRLQGQGIANQRREIAKGLVESVDVLNRVGINSQEASALL